MKQFYFHAPRDLTFGPGVCDTVGKKCRKLNATRVLLVTSAGMPKRPAFGRICDSLEKAGVQFEIFNRVSPEPPVRDLEACVAYAKDHRSELIIGIGGGSAMDVAKTTAVLLKNEGTVFDYFGMHKIPRDGLPTIMLPTTAGSGSEVTPNSVFIIEEEKIKKGIEDPHQIPSCALVDPELSKSMPPALTAATGMDALTHGIESFVSKRSSPVSETFSLKAIALASKYLVRAYENGSDIEARANMALAATLAGLAFGNAGNGGAHACAYPLSGRFGVPHGTANALMLPYIVEFNMAVTDKYRLLEPYLGKDIPQALHDLVDRLGLPTRLRDMKIAEDDIESMAEQVSKIERHWAINPRRATKEELVEIYKKAY